MKDPKIKTKVVHSQSKPAWNVVGIKIPGKFKIARLPYVECTDESVTKIEKQEALDHAEFISFCFNNSTRILELKKYLEWVSEKGSMDVNQYNEIHGHVLCSKANYKSKDGTIKKCIEINGKFYAPMNDLLNYKSTL